MNRYVKALNFIKGTLSAFHQRTNSEVPKKETEWLNTLQELTEKATPKKPIKDGSGYLTCDKVQYICPRCNQIMVRVICIKSHKPNYCYKCGGALDWSEEE